MAAAAATPPVSAPATTEQRFFVATAAVWHEVTREEALRTQVQAGFHSPARVRATQPIRTMDAFHEAFGTRPGDAMDLPPEERVVVR